MGEREREGVGKGGLDIVSDDPVKGGWGETSEDGTTEGRTVSGGSEMEEDVALGEHSTDTGRGDEGRVEEAVLA